MDMHVHLKSGPLMCLWEEVHLGERRMAMKAPDFRGKHHFVKLVRACCELRIFSSHLGKYCMSATEGGGN